MASLSKQPPRIEAAARAALSRHQEVPYAGQIPGQGAEDNLVMQGWDVTDLVLRQRKLEMQAFRDPLTGMPNRFAFLARLDQELTTSRLSGREVAVISIDVDDFTAVNDFHGHEMGDQVLTELARRFAASIGPDDLMGRTGGDEFAIICPGRTGWPAVADLMDRLRAVAAESISIPSGAVGVTVSLGAAFAEETGEQPYAAADLMARADQRMFRAKPAARSATDRKTAAVIV